MAGTGGARPGAGRKRKSEKYASQIEAAERIIANDLPRFIQNMILIADAGDRAANEYLINRVMGKPTERHEHDIDNEIAEYLAALAPGGKAEVPR